MCFEEEKRSDLDHQLQYTSEHFCGGKKTFVWK